MAGVLSKPVPHSISALEELLVMLPQFLQTFRAVGHAIKHKTLAAAVPELNQIASEVQSIRRNFRFVGFDEWENAWEEIIRVAKLNDPPKDPKLLKKWLEDSDIRTSYSPDWIDLHGKLVKKKVERLMGALSKFHKSYTDTQEPLPPIPRVRPFAPREMFAPPPLAWVPPDAPELSAELSAELAREPLTVPGSIEEMRAIWERSPALADAVARLPRGVLPKEVRLRLEEAADAYDPDAPPGLPRPGGAGRPRFHSREWCGRGRKGFDEPLRGSTRPW